MEESINFIPLLIVLVLAFTIPLILGRFRWLPVVLGEIAAGIVIGHSGLNLIGESEILEIFSSIGLAFLMFLAGIEIDFNRLIPARSKNQTEDSEKGQSKSDTPNLLGYAGIVYLLTLALAIPGGFLLNGLGLQGNPWMLAFVLSATSLGVLLPVLKGRGLTHTTSGQVIFLSAVIADFLTVILLTIFLILLSRGFDLEVFSVVLLFLAFFLFYRLADRFFQIRPVQRLVEELSQTTVQIKVRGALAILMAFVALATLLGVELILGAFLAGMIISLIRIPEDIDLIHKLEAFGYGFFIPVFFIMVGVELELGQLADSPNSLLLLPVLLVISLIVKILPALILKRIMSWREVLGGGLLLNTHLSLEIAVAVIGVRLEILSPATGTALVLFSVITVLLMPLLANALLPMPVSRQDRWMLIYSANDLGMQVARELMNRGEKVRFLENSHRLARTAQEAGFEVIYRENIDECLSEASKEYIQALLTLSVHDDRNLMVCNAAVCAGIDHVVALVNDPARLPEYTSLDVNTFNPALYQPSLLATLARSPDILKILTTTSSDQGLSETAITNQDIDGRRVRTLGLPGNLLVLAVTRNGEMIVPHGNTRLKFGDRLTLFGNLQELGEANTLLRGMG
jgi:Kef-type K+ transport system membrane component KefB/Trk K+ transport system NAD-binding subunit